MNRYRLYNSAYKHIKGRELPPGEELNLKVLKGEKFAFQIALTQEEGTLISLGRYNHIGYRGLGKRVRVVPEKTEGMGIRTSFLGYVADDDGTTLTADPILREEYLYSEGDQPTIIWVEGEIDRDYTGGRAELTINLLSQEGYSKEILEEAITVDIEVVNMVIPKLKDADFHLDLWQHLSSWARHYKLPFWGEDHFKVIDSYSEELASMGEKVITVVASDFTWEGQGCFQVEKNPSNLFEHNIVAVKKNLSGRIECDFTALERFLDICFRHGMEEEIDIFGLLASWQRTDFGNPLRDYDDYIRVAYFSERDESYGYIDNREDMREYIKQVFAFFREKNLMDRVRVISDMPKDPEAFTRWSEFLRDSAGEDLQIKTALHEGSFTERLDDVSDLCLSLPLLLKWRDKLDDIREKIEGKLTWYVCWFPDKLNHFISSPLIESRLTGWYSHYMGLDGFLRWDYALWTANPYDDISYKYPRWKAGDMFFIYPGRDMKPVRSIRWENLRFGLQDNILLKLAEKIAGPERIQSLLREVLGDKEDMKTTGEFSVELSYSTEYREYMLIRDKIIEILKER